jgi:hypothetical protein
MVLVGPFHTTYHPDICAHGPSCTAMTESCLLSRTFGEMFSWKDFSSCTKRDRQSLSCTAHRLSAEIGPRRGAVAKALVEAVRRCCSKPRPISLATKILIGNRGARRRSQPRNKVPPPSLVLQLLFSGHQKRSRPMTTFVGMLLCTPVAYVPSPHPARP